VTSRAFVVDLAAAVTLVLIGLIAAPGPALLLAGAVVVLVGVAIRLTVGELLLRRYRTRRLRRLSRSLRSSPGRHRWRDL
jgi:hypothetical protein